MEQRIHHLIAKVVAELQQSQMILRNNLLMNSINNTNYNQSACKQII